MRTCIVSFLLALPAFGGCEDSFKKSGNIVTGTNFSASVVVADLTIAEAVERLRGIAESRKLDVLVADAENGNMLLEQRESMRNKPIPYVLSISTQGRSANVHLVVKLNKGAIAKTEDVRNEMCAILGQIATAQAGTPAPAPAEIRKVDAQVLSDELSRQMQDSAASIPLRYKDRTLTITGRVKFVMQDYGSYRVGFDIREQRDRILATGVSKVDLSCVIAPSHRAWAVALRPGEKLKLTGQFLSFDPFQRVMVFQNCRPE